MKKKINLYWYKVQEGYGNFGDELSYFLISKLSNKEIRRIFIPAAGFAYLYRCLSFIYHNRISCADYLELLHQFFIKDVIIAIGSVIGIPQKKTAKIWGSGIIKRNELIHKATFLAVRGRYTQNRLKELGLEAPDVVGDPALLLPLIHKPPKVKRYKIGIIPHHIHYKEVVSQVGTIEDILVINLTETIETIIESINCCEVTISTSLHGLIVSHAYNIPSLWIDFGLQKLAGDNIKFCDYFSSVNINEYLPFKINLSNINVSKIIELFEINSELSKINCDLVKLQRDLLNSAPFPVLKKYVSK